MLEPRWTDRSRRLEQRIRERLRSNLTLMVFQTRCQLLLDYCELPPSISHCEKLPTRLITQGLLVLLQLISNNMEKGSGTAELGFAWFKVDLSFPCWSFFIWLWKDSGFDISSVFASEWVEKIHPLYTRSSWSRVSCQISSYQPFKNLYLYPWLMVLVEQLRVSHESYCSYFNVFNILNTVLWLNAKTKTEIMIHCSKQPQL